MAHVQVAKHMEERAPGSAPKRGDRVEYIVCASEAKRVVDKAEEPRHAAENGLAIDYIHYLEAIERPLLDLVQLPLEALAPGSYEDLLAFVKQAGNRARALCAEHARARVGATWKEGHVTKDGRVQTKLHIPGRVAPQQLPPPQKKAKQTLADAATGSQQITSFFKASAPTAPRR